MEESLEQKKRRLFGKQYLNEYKNVINKITKSNTQDYKILSILETDKIAENGLKLKLKFSKKVLFKDKEELKNVVFEIFKSDENVYLYTSLSMDCGAIMIKSITSFNFDFDFMDDYSGILSLIDVNAKNKILLDFYEEDKIQYMEIELYQ
jgi:hypothetical protein